MARAVRAGVLGVTGVRVARSVIAPPVGEQERGERRLGGVRQGREARWPGVSLRSGQGGRGRPGAG